MAETTNIEWADATFNPWIGCAKVSPACTNCYAEAWAIRHGKGELWGGETRHRTSVANWRGPIAWDADAVREGQRRRVFCASLADVFDNVVPEQWRVDLLELIGRTSALDWLLLTKRIGNAADMLERALEQLSHGLNSWRHDAGAGYWRSVWIGATVVTQSEYDRDMPKLLATPASTRFLSIEPLLGPIDLHLDKYTELAPCCSLPGCLHCDGSGTRQVIGLHWVIVGGESGPQARPMNPQWVRAIRDQCDELGIPFLFKQWGEWAPVEGMTSQAIAAHYRTHRAPRRCLVEGVEMLRVGKKEAGRGLDGLTWSQFPEARA